MDYEFSEQKYDKIYTSFVLTVKPATKIILEKNLEDQPPYFLEELPQQYI